MTTLRRLQFFLWYLRGWRLLPWTTSKFSSGLIGLALVLLTGPVAAAEDALETEPGRPIQFVLPSSFFPYSFANDRAEPSGFSVDLVDALCKVMNLEHRLNLAEVGSYENVLAGAGNGTAFFVAETKERNAALDFSIPVLRFETVVVVRKADTQMRSLEDLHGRRIGIPFKGMFADAYLREKIPDASRLYAPTEQLLKKLAEGGCDGVVMSRLAALSAMDHLQLKGLRILTALPGCDIRCGLAVRKGDSVLLARFNEGLAVLQREGTLNEIYQKWFGRYEKRVLTPVEIVSYVAAALALICIGALWGFLRQRSLLNRIEKQASELEEQRSLLAALYDKHPMATVVLDIPAKGSVLIVSLNQEAVLFLGRGKSECVGKSLGELGLAREVNECVEEVVRRCRASGKPERWDMQLPGSRRVLEVATMPLGTQKDRNHVCVIFSDITKRRLMDQEIARSRRLRALGELVGGIAHEFNNLLTPILATASLLRSAPAPVVVSPEELDIIDQAALRAADLTKRLLAFGRKTDDPAKSVHLSEAVANCEALLKTMIDRRIEWINVLPPDLPPAAFNPTDFNQIVFNLVLNARDTLLERLAKNTDQTWKPQLRISVSSLPANARRPRTRTSLNGVTGWQKLSVSDNGMGIPHEIVDRIFEPFYTTKAVGKGTGLGLSMVWHQVTEAGGDVEVDTKPGEGTTFHIFFPCRERMPNPEPVRKPASAAVPVPKSRILIAEDEPLIASTAAKILERMGHGVSRCADGLKAWETIQTAVAAYDLLLIDLSMPRLNGIDLVRRIRTLPYQGRIMVMSGRVAEEDLRTLKELRVDRLLPKPFTTDQLMENVAAVLTAKKP